MITGLTGFPTHSEIASDIASVAIAKPEPYENILRSNHFVVILPLGPSNLRVTLLDDQKTFNVSIPYSLTFLLPNQHCLIQQSQNVEHLYAVINQDHVNHVAERDFAFDKKSLRPIFNLYHPSISSLAESLKHFVLSPHCTGFAYLDAITTAMLTHIMSVNSPPNLRKNTLQVFSQRKLAEIQITIDEMLSRRTPISKLAEKIGMSQAIFYRLFKTTTGQSPYQYVLDRRLKRARELIVEGKLSLADTAYACGFSSQSHMTDVFRQKLGVTPGLVKRRSNDNATAVTSPKPMAEKPHKRT